MWKKYSLDVRLRFMENPYKIQRKIDELNGAAIRPSRPLGSLLTPSTPYIPWIAVAGYFAVTGFSYNQSTPTFNPNYGYTVKVFVNTDSGEVKMFASNLFEG